MSDQLANLMDSVVMLANHIGAEPPTQPEPARDKSGRRVRKFQRRGVGEEAPSTAAKPAEDAGKDTAGAAAFNKNVAWPRQGQAAAPEDAASTGVRPPRKRPNKRMVAVVIQLAGLSLVGLGFLAGRMSVPPAENPAAATAEVAPMSMSPESGGGPKVNDQAFQTANTALRSSHKGDLEGARKIYEDALAQRLVLPGMYYQLARLALQRNDLLEADLSLDHSSSAGEFLTPAHYTRARMAGMKGKYEEVVRQFQLATRAEPFNGRYFFYLAEAVRRRGQTKSAIEIFDQAMDRAHTLAEGRLYRFKQDLAKIEAGDAAYDAELDGQLKLEGGTPERWLLAAARDITRSAYPAAAESLKKAAGLLPPPVYALEIKDYLFQAVQGEPVLTPLLKFPPIQDSTELNGPFLDPVVLPAELADPAVWPVAMPTEPKTQ